MLSRGRIPCKSLRVAPCSPVPGTLSPWSSRGCSSTVQPETEKFCVCSLKEILFRLKKNKNVEGNKKVQFNKILDINVKRVH